MFVLIQIKISLKTIFRNYKETFIKTILGMLMIKKLFINYNFICQKCTQIRVVESINCQYLILFSINLRNEVDEIM